MLLLKREREKRELFFGGSWPIISIGGRSSTGHRLIGTVAVSVRRSKKRERERGERTELTTAHRSLTHGRVAPSSVVGTDRHRYLLPKAER